MRPTLGYWHGGLEEANGFFAMHQTRKFSKESRLLSPIKKLSSFCRKMGASDWFPFRHTRFSLEPFYIKGLCAIIIGAKTNSLHPLAAAASGSNEAESLSYDFLSPPQKKTGVSGEKKKNFFAVYVLVETSRKSLKISRFIAPPSSRWEVKNFSTWSLFQRKNMRCATWEWRKRNLQQQWSF